MKLKLIHGDCLEEMKRLPDRSIDLFLCDLPYGCLSNANGNKVPCNEADENGVRRIVSKPCAWDIKIDLDAFWTQVERLMKDDHTPIIHFCSTKFGNELINSKEKWFRYDLVWNKMCGVSFLSANKMPMRSHENIYVFAKKGARYNRVDIEGDFKQWQVGKNGVRSGNHADAGLPKSNIYGGEGKRCVLSVIDCKTSRSNQKGQKKEHKHPTQKPNDLYKWLIERYSKPGDTILDPTAGSFASCFTAIDCGRQAIGIEKDDKFYNKALSLVKE